VSPSPANLDRVLALLGERLGLDFPASRRDAAEAGILRAMSRAGARDPEVYLDLLLREGPAWDDLVAELTVGETYFFREAAQFDFIRREVLPGLRRRGGTVRAWSAACASGEEAYSLAIVLDQEGFGERSFLLATDVNQAALVKARQATYTAWSLRGEGAAAAGPYLLRRGDRYVLAERLRQRVTFAALNLAQDRYPAEATGVCVMDVILCRNVLIYFGRETVRSVARRLYDTLAPGGWLFAGASDPPLGGEAPFESVLAEGGVFYRRPTAPAPGALVEMREASPKGAAPPPLQRGGLTPPRPAPLRASPAPAPPPLDHQEEARAAFARGDYARAAALAGDRADCAALRVRSLANLDPVAAEQACAEALRRQPLDVELHYLHAILLLGLGREVEAGGAVRRVLYLDRTLAAAHFTLGTVLERRGDPAAACRAYRAARDLAAARPSREPVPLAEGESAEQLAAAAAARLAALGAGGGTRA
jgi:chemotaxis protein methyltransferase CheR